MDPETGAGAATVSVVIPFLNGDNFLREAVASVFAQHWPDWELILLDDGSTDASGAYARDLALANAARVRYKTHPGGVNRGLAASRLEGARQARGDLLLFLDHDDVLHPHGISAMVAALEADPRAGASFAGLRYWVYDDPSGQSDTFLQYDPFEPGLVDGRRMLRDLIRSDDRHPAPCSTLFRRDIYLAARSLTSSAYDGMYEDTAVLFAILLLADVALTNEVVASYRLHGASMCHQAQLQGTYQPAVVNADRTRFLRWSSRNLPFDMRTRGRLWRTLLRDWLQRWRGSIR